MKLRRKEDGSGALVLDRIEPFFVDQLRRLPHLADPADDPAARSRLFSAPMARGVDGDEFNEDWERYVAPELRSLFRTAQQNVEEDLAPLPEAAGPETVGVFDPAAFEPTSVQLEIPVKHLEAWLSVLNQARLVIAARRGFGERDMNSDLPFPPFTDRDLDLFRVNFYDGIQQIILSEMGFE